MLLASEHWGLSNNTVANVPQIPPLDSASEAEVTLAVVRCPDGYCRPSEAAWQDVCAGHRQGRLCGSCKQGYSQAITTTNCVATDRCGGSTTAWFVVVALLLILCYVGYCLVFNPSAGGPLASLFFFFQLAPIYAEPLDLSSWDVVFGLFRYGAVPFSLAG